MENAKIPKDCDIEDKNAKYEQALEKKRNAKKLLKEQLSEKEEEVEKVQL